MSEAMTVPPLNETEVKRIPTVYFIDDSATMREVIKIAFRRENINVITCADAASALAQFEQNRPDVVITDVIMPDQDGYAVCSQIKQHPDYGGTPVVLMSGVVNKSVADKAVAVKADELIRKPFQPQELIGRVKSLLEPKRPAEAPAADRPAVSTALSNLFAPPAPAPQPPRPLAPTLPPPEQRGPESVWPRALAEAFVAPRPGEGAPAQHNPQPAAPSARPAASAADVHKLRVEIARLELLVKKLQTEMQIERQYTQALELQIQALTRLD
ncbi:MAG TPA: response regulator [Candidatus Methylomirabilis sp.]|nr:response regulator [Candidatus Methylomirabilis sp.]